MKTFSRRAEYLKYAGKILSKKNSLPVYFIHFITENCNARCFHCLLGERGAVENELRLDEIEKISRSMPDFMFLLLTGGEPFLRDDLPEIIGIYAKNNSILRCLVPSNGSLTEKTVAAARRVLAKHRDLSFGIDISIDAAGEKHDELRQMPGLFEKAVNTYKALGEVEKEFSNFDRAVTITVSRRNQDELIETYEYLTGSLGAKNIGIRFTRGEPRDPGALDIDINKYIELTRRAGSDIRGSRTKGFSGFPFSSLINAEQAMAHDNVVRTLEAGTRNYNCYAGTLAAVMKSSGELFACELLGKSMGNLRELGYDFKKAWFSTEAAGIREGIKNRKCSCTHENFYACSALFDPLMYGGLAWKWFCQQAGCLMPAGPRKKT